MTFTTRPELRGTFGMVASTHWLASAAGMSVLERGGNAFDAAVATGFTLQVVEPHLNGPGGEVPAIIWPVAKGEPIALCGQGVAPAAATIERYRELGHELVPGTGVLAACVPGAFGGWLLMLEQFGTWRLEDVLSFAIGYAEDGFPFVAGIRATIERTEELLREWPGSRELYLPPPEVGTLFRNPTLAATYRRILDEARGGSREEEIEKARRAYYEGFVAEEIDRFVAAEGGLLAADDMARWRASLEPVASLEYGGLTVCKTLPWAAGPVGLQQLALLDGFDLSELSPAEFVHVVTECAKLAFADRDALYGDAEVPLETLLSPEYNAERRALIGEDASSDYTPGLGRLPTVVGAAVTPGAGEPTRGDTVHLDVVDQLGQHGLVDAERRLAAQLAGDPVARMATRNARADVLARGRAAVVAAAGRAAADDALSRPRAARREAVPRVGHPRRRPAGAMGAARLPPPRRPRLRTCRRRSTRRSSIPTT